MEPTARVVLIHFVYKDERRAEVQVKLCSTHWSSIKTIAKVGAPEKVQREAEKELLKLEWRSRMDSAIIVHPEIIHFVVDEPAAWESK